MTKKELKKVEDWIYKEHHGFEYYGGEMVVWAVSLIRFLKTLVKEDTKEIKKSKKHICDGGDDYGLVDCLQCEKEMLKSLRSKKR